MRIPKDLLRGLNYNGHVREIPEEVPVAPAKEAVNQLAKTKKELEKCSRAYIQSVIREKGIPDDITDELSTIVEKSIGIVLNEERGKYSRLCAATVVAELYEGAHKKEDKRPEFTFATHRVLQYGSQMTYDYEDAQKVHPEIMSAIFRGFSENQDMFQIETHLYQYINDPFNPVQNPESE
jgi:hypothetical protein